MSTKDLEKIKNFIKYLLDKELEQQHKQTTRIKECHAKIDGLSNEYQRLSLKHSEMEKRMKAMENKLLEYDKWIMFYKDIKIKMNNLSNDYQGLVEKHCNIEKRLGSIEVKLGRVKEQLKSFAKSLKVKINSRSNDNQGMKEALSEVGNIIKPTEDELNEAFDQLTSFLEEIESKTYNLNNDYIRLIGELLETNLFSCSWVFLILILTAACIFAAFQYLRLWKTVSKSSAFTHVKIPSKNPEKGIGIVSFSLHNKKFHENLISKAFPTKHLPIHTHLIQRPEDILSVNPYQIIIIFVDFNERNIILENPNTEIGDIRHQTTEVFIKFGCDVFVVYCKDYGSTYLPSYKLYNPRLLSISMHEILRKLSKKDRVFTVYAAFHQQQVKILERCFDHETELF